MKQAESGRRPRAVRVEYPLEASFAGESFELSEFTLNLSVSGIFLPTERAIEPRTPGSLTFRSPRWANPLITDCEVVRRVPADDPAGQPQGLGIQFHGLTPDDHNRLESLVRQAQQDGSAVDEIRNAVRGGENLLTELRRRPVSQKMMLATRAQHGEFDALIRDGNPTVISRLLENPRLTAASVELILRQPTSPSGILAKVKRRRWLARPELVALYCLHPLSPLPDALSMLPRLSVQQLTTIERDPDMRPQLRAKAKQLLAARATGAGVSGTGRSQSGL